MCSLRLFEICYCRSLIVIDVAVDAVVVDDVFVDGVVFAALAAD